jgi:hypothetical protein
MRLVAQALDEIEQGVARWQLERIFSRHEKGFASGIAIRTRGDSDQRSGRHAFNVEIEGSNPFQGTVTTCRLGIGEPKWL